MTTSSGSSAPPWPAPPRRTGPADGRGAASLSNELFRGVLRWDLLVPFPTDDDAERAAVDTHVAELTRYLRAHLDPTHLDATGELPDDVVATLRARGWLRALVDIDDGGLGLSPFGAFRLIEAAASWSVPVANVMGIANGFGGGAWLRLMPDGPLRDLLREHVAGGNLSGWADTEPAGSGNRVRATTATPVDGGAAYLLNGEKVHVGNGAVADLLAVSATVVVDGVPGEATFFVDTASPGFRVVSRHDFMGLRGAPIGHLRLTDVRVPAWRMVSAHERDARAREHKELIYLARTLSVAPPSLAIARLCLAWAREFVARRRIDGHPLGAFEEIRHVVASSVADTFAADTFARWTLLGRGADLLHEHATLKNVSSLACWRVVDRTVGLLGGEGFETAAGKAARGVTPLPVERHLRDARGLRISGGVDFLLDYLVARIRLTDCHYAAPAPAEADTGPARRAVAAHHPEHVASVTDQAARLGRVCRELTANHPDREELFARQHTLGVLARIASELLVTATVLARAATEGTDPALVGVHCAAARRRLGSLWAELEDHDGPGVADVARGWLGGDGDDALLGDVVTDPPGPRGG